MLIKVASAAFVFMADRHLQMATSSFTSSFIIKDPIVAERFLLSLQQQTKIKTEERDFGHETKKAIKLLKHASASHFPPP